MRNNHSHSARHAKVFILRKLKKNGEAVSLIEESLQIDPFNFGCLFEKYLLLADKSRNEANDVLCSLQTLSRNWVHNFIEYALDYSHAGLYDEAFQFLSVYTENTNEIYALAPYYLGWFVYHSGNIEKAKKYFTVGSEMKPDFVFPNRVEEVLILQTALQLNQSDFKAWYYLGNIWYDKRQYDDAVQCWQRSVELNDLFPTAYRNLALAYYNKNE